MDYDLSLDVNKNYSFQRNLIGYNYKSLVTDWSMTYGSIDVNKASSFQRNVIGSRSFTVIHAVLVKSFSWPHTEKDFSREMFL